MRSEALDITIHSRGSTVWMRLSGPFHNEQVPNIRQEIKGLIDDGNKNFVVDMDRVTVIDDGVVPLFLFLLNLVKGKGGDLRLIFRNDIVTTAFAENKNLFSIFPDAFALARGGFFSALKQRGKLYARKTGIRISRPVALFLLITLCGWFLSLVFIIHMQSQRIQTQQSVLSELQSWKNNADHELTLLRERIKPLEQLGILKDTVVPHIIIPKARSIDSLKQAPVDTVLKTVPDTLPKPAVSSDTIKK